MSDPKRMLVWMTLFLAALVAACAALRAPLLEAFTANVVFNGLILSVFAAGVVVAFVQVARLGSAWSWVDQTSRGFTARASSRLVASLARTFSGRERDGVRISPLAMRAFLDGVGMRLDAARELSRYFVGLLIFLGLLGTFWGLIDTVSGVGRVLGGVTGSGDPASAFAGLKARLEGPLAGMGTAFSSSLFGLAGALALGVLDLQVGQAQNRFFSDLEEFLAGRADLPEHAETQAAGAPPAYFEALLAQVAENLAQMQRAMARGEEDRRSAQAGLAQLTDRLADLAEQLRAQQKVIMALEKSRAAQQPALAELTRQVASSVASSEELRGHLRSVDHALGRLLTEVAGARQQVPDAMRQEIRLLARSLGRPTLPHA